MGALHEGHMTLIREARAHRHVVVSLFVNPIQFAAHEDLSKYPRQEQNDIAQCEAAKVDAIFVPDATEMTERMRTRVSVSGVSELWEGTSRPGHFDGVATIVNKLFQIVRPRHAYFGQKDYQQCAVIGQMVADLNMPVELEFVPTVREKSGLALSSRNQYLTHEQREDAAQLYATLVRTRQELLRGDEPVSRVLEAGIASLTIFGFQVEYLALVDGSTLEPLNSPTESSRLIVAAKFHSVRLIDNIALS